MRSQSAMEYLMTYGWAILIIAIVIMAFSYLGVFNSGNFAPKATAGACQVVRTAAATNLEGQCSNEQPQFVAQFNGQNSYVSIPSGIYFTGSPFTVTGWAYIRSFNSWERFVDFGNGPTNNNILLAFSQGISGQPLLQFFQGSSGTSYYSSTQLPLDTWVFMTGTFDGSNIIVYSDGIEIGTTTASSAPLGVQRLDNYIGRSNWISDGYFNGMISNVQIYNTSLSANQIKSLYNEGIGGAPLSPQYLVAWWPLNGNAQDYSGNGNNGVPSGISYNGSWASGYVQP